MRLHPETEIQFVKGVGPKLAKLFGKLNIFTAGELLWHIPRRYEDRTLLPPLRGLRPGDVVSVRGRIQHVEARPSRGRSPVRALLTDGQGQISLVFFGQAWLAAKLREIKGEVIAFGTVKEGLYGLEIASPEWEVLEDEADGGTFARVMPVYALTEGLAQRNVRRAIGHALSMVSDLPDPVPEALRLALNLDTLTDAIRRVHLPESIEAAESGRKRLVFDEFFSLQLVLQLRRAESQAEAGIAFPIATLRGEGPPPVVDIAGSLFSAPAPLIQGTTLEDEIRQILPFELTRAQVRVVEEIWGDMARPHPMNRLVQGDVGSGKTAVAACAMLAAARSGYQSALMAPTEILAEQHALNLERIFAPIGMEVVLLVGKLTSKQRARVGEAVRSSAAKIVVGTHALIQEGVEFERLGLAVIDEQHRFGVMQRVALRQKSHLTPDVLVMTATPIPRTLTMAVYGDLDVSVIDELPPGRKPIRTHWKRSDQRQHVYEGVRDMLRQGRQAYFVCPAVAESEAQTTKAAVAMHEQLQKTVYPEFRVGLLHGQMKSADKEQAMQAFRQHELDVLVATVVIEVGVDVPNASVMVIEDANRFGLSQLHQIRGRVGRGKHASFCVLIAEATTDDARERMETMVRTQNGFEISEVDLRLRGPGDVLGTRQSGNLGLKVADLLRDLHVLEVARRAAAEVIESDPQLLLPEHRLLRQLLVSKKSEDAWIPLS